MRDLVFKYLVTIFVCLTDGLNGNNFNYDREKVIRKQICDQGGLADVEINWHVPLWRGNYGVFFDITFTFFISSFILKVNACILS